MKNLNSSALQLKWGMVYTLTGSPGVVFRATASPVTGQQHPQTNTILHSAEIGQLPSTKAGSSSQGSGTSWTGYCCMRCSVEARVTVKGEQKKGRGQEAASGTGIGVGSLSPHQSAFLENPLLQPARSSISIQPSPMTKSSGSLIFFHQKSVGLAF